MSDQTGESLGKAEFTLSFRPGKGGEEKIYVTFPVNPSPKAVVQEVPTRERVRFTHYAPDSVVPTPFGPWQIFLECVDVYSNRAGKLTHVEVVFALKVFKVMLGNLSNGLENVQVLSPSKLQLKLILRTKLPSKISSQYYVIIPGLGTGLLSGELVFLETASYLH